MRTISWSFGKDKQIHTHAVTPARASRPGPGRPSRAQQAERREELLEAALDIFLERGFDGTTVDEIAARVGMSKRTVYTEHADKPALFQAAVRRAIERYTLPRAAIEAVANGDLEETLKAIGRLRIANIATPIGTKLQRILAAQAYRFPELSRLAFSVGTGPVIEYLMELFAQFDDVGEISVLDSRRAANAYLSVVVGSVTRMIVAGRVPSQAEIEEHLTFTVNLFLNGVRRRPMSNHDHNG